ncbi:MAG: hypothetical protein Q9219_000187 [cf. Caloplaca sp. 3 TL-2023]
MQSISIIFDNGDIVVVKENPAVDERIEIVGSIDAGISAAAWSPDEEILVVATKASTFIYLTKDFEELTSVEFTRRDLDISDHVSVGWGKKETQFKGRKARALRDPTVPETVDDGRLTESHDLHDTTISWRGDGAYVAINSIEESTQRRVIRVYSREGILDSVSEPVNGLIGPLSWRPVGDLLAGVQLFEDKRQIIFFERNGLRHGQFPLRPLDGVTDDKSVSVRSLQWNTDSTVLAISYDDRVQLWTMGNCHWYLKQEIMDPDLKWHSEKPLIFALVSSSKDSIRRLQYKFEISADPIFTPFDYGVVAVIDGKILKVTPFRQANIPPPMSLYEVALDANANDVLVALERSGNGSSEEPLFKISVLHLKGVSTYILNISAGQAPIKIANIGGSYDESSIATKASVETHGSLQLSLEANIADPPPNTVQLTDNGSLLANSKVLTRGCTSYLITPSHLIFTTSQHLLKFVHLSAGTEIMEVPPDTPESDERCRSIERGARLVTAMPSIFAVVLQMPRGNLETVYPRVLVLAGIRQSINEKKYKKAFLACRSQRVDMNILHDHRPEQFAANVGLFIDQIRKVEHIDLFLSSLREEDVSRTMYRETLRAEERSDSSLTKMEDSKVNKICNAFLVALSGRRSNVKNMITAQVYANRLFDNALGLYDLQLALLVAQQSQKDPREYLPFLQNFQRMEPLRRKFSLDDHLGRFKKALQHLRGLNAFDELKAYTLRHGLYQEALGFYRYEEDNYSTIMKLYADHLVSISRFKEAAIAFQYMNDYMQASECYRQANLWHDSLSTAALIPMQDVQLRSLAESLTQAAVESKDFRAAATICDDYLQDISSAAKYFCKGYLFSEAFRIITLSSQSQLLETVFDSGLAETMASITELLADCKAQLTAQVPRIRELREKKKQDPLAFFEGDINEGKDIPDDISLAPTDASTMGGSLFTRYTNRSATGTADTGTSRRSSKNRRKEERKRARGKKGSVYEEEYLVNSVRRLVERVNSVRFEVGRLVEWLVRRKMVERARAVAGGMKEVVGLCQKAIEEVFVREETETTGEIGSGQERLDVPTMRDFEGPPFLI